MITLRRPRSAIIILVIILTILLGVLSTDTLSTQTKWVGHGSPKGPLKGTAPKKSLLSLVPQPGSDQFKAVLDVEREGCPPQQPAIIGIFSAPSLPASARRNYLRERYRDFNAQLPQEDRIDFVFVFGKGTTYEDQYQLDWELRNHPSDTITTPHLEGVNNGKAYDWMMAARNLMYTPHPTKAGRYCQKYTFIGKGDDDEAINLRALVRHIKTAKKENVPQLAGFMMYEDTEFKERVWYAHGMLYFGSPELVEWIHTSPIPQEQPELLALPEDHVFGYLLRESKIYMKRTEWRPYYFETHKDEWMVTDDTIIAHPCKALDSFFRCMTLFDRVTQDHPLLIPENAKLRLEHLGLLATDEVVNQTIKKVKEAINKEPMFIMAQFNRLLLGQAVYLTIAEFNLPKETIDKIITKVTFDLEKGANGAVKVPVNVDTLKSYMKEYS